MTRANTSTCGLLILWLLSNLATPLPAQQTTPPAAPDATATLSESEAAATRPSHAAVAAVSDWDLYTGGIYSNTSPLWVQADYLLWWLNGADMPALVTTSPSGTSRDNAGVLGAPGTEILFGGDQYGDSARSGFHTALGVRLGHWFDHFMASELQFDYLWIGDGQAGDYETSTPQHAILGRPFWNSELGQQDAQLVSYPGVGEGGIWVETDSDFRSAGVIFRQGWLFGDGGRLEWLAGYRYLQLQEDLFVDELVTSTDAGGLVPAGTVFEIHDEFRVSNEFHGGDIGLQWWSCLHGWNLEVTSKVALGGLTRSADIYGSTLIDVAGGPTIQTAGGLLALPTNMGSHDSCRFVAVPELNVKVRRQLSRFFVLTLGYSVLFVDQVARVGDAVDLAVNPSQLNGGILTGEPRPTYALRGSQLWLHGLQVGLEW
jgi:hypothetical protein